ncbi:tetratricopeptide repeat protein [Candidatus Amarobacter glycogenicus]|uniref:tetratricopeptide repeat protein n=1 Tax=Candidatus Amarobacter glycogenicus TaxID=3140699 RepID=UPI002A0D2B4B|nr:tetratricopeptide repeat protein [Dehalococcoidia bacterium]
MLNHLGEALWRTGRLIEARNALTGALDLLASAGDDPYLHAQVEGNLGNVALQEGDLDMAAALWQSALNSMAQLDVVFDKIGLLNNLGGLAYAQADYGRALAFFQESLELAQELGDERGIQEALRNLTLAIGRHDEVVGSEQLCRAAGDLALARRNYEQAVSLYDRLGHRREAAQARNNLGGVLFRQYEIEAADAVWSDALAVLESVGDMVTAADVRRNLELIARRGSQRRIGCRSGFRRGN